MTCHYCPWHTTASDFDGELPTVEWLKIISDLHAEGVRIFIFEGGEPTLRKDLTDLLALAKQLGSSRILATNGSGRIWKYSSLVSTYTISIDGVEGVHDAVRGKGSFSKIVQNLEQRRSQRVIVITVLNRANCDSIHELLMTLAPLVDGFLFTFQYPYNGRDENVLAPREVARVKAVLLKLKSDYTILNPKHFLDQPMSALPCHRDLSISIDHRGVRSPDCFVDLAEKHKCDECELSCYQILSSFKDFNFEAWFHLYRHLLEEI